MRSGRRVLTLRCGGGFRRVRRLRSRTGVSLLATVRRRSALLERRERWRLATLPWRRQPATEFGSESILFGINRAEQFLTVERHQGTRTWIWRLDATHGSPHLDAAGGVRFSDAGRLSGYHILPVQILDREGHDVTPNGLSWSLDRNGDADWRLALRLRPEAAAAISDRPDRPDRGMRTRRGGGTTSCTAATSTGSSSLGITKPSAAVAGDVLVAQLTVRSTGAITAPVGRNQVGATAQDVAGPIEQALFWPRVDGSAPVTTTFAWAGGNADASGGIVTYKGVDPFVGSTRVAAQRVRRRAEGRMRQGTHSASPSRPPPRTRCSRRPTESPMA